jgi:hypothetical protein
MEELTPQEQTQKSISAAFDSVNLINELKQKSSLDSEEQDRLDRNKEHLNIMLAKDWFEEALTATQKQQIQSAAQ